MFVFIWENNSEKMALPHIVSCVSHSVMSNSATPWNVVHQVPLSMGFSRQEYWSGVPFPIPGNLRDPGIESGSTVLQVESLQSNHQESPYVIWASPVSFTKDIHCESKFYGSVFSITHTHIKISPMHFASSSARYKAWMERELRNNCLLCLILYCAPLNIVWLSGDFWWEMNWSSLVVKLVVDILN